MAERYAARARQRTYRAPSHAAPPRQPVEPRGRGASIVLRTILIALVTLAVGFVAGVIVAPSIKLPWRKGSVAPAALSGAPFVSSDELDATFGSYQVGDEVVEVSVREAITEVGSLGTYQRPDGSFQLPAADSVLAIARDRLLAQEAERLGFVASESDMVAYAEEVMGTSDMAEIAKTYGMDEDGARASLMRSASIAKLRDSVVDDVVVPDLPAAPEAVEEGSEDVFLAKYGAYVCELAGDEWNAAANTWAKEGGPYREALRDYTISNDGATYSAALAAYEVARSLHAEAQAVVAQQWTDYVNEILAPVTVELRSAVA